MHTKSIRIRQYAVQHDDDDDDDDDDEEEEEEEEEEKEEEEEEEVIYLKTATGQSIKGFLAFHKTDNVMMIQMTNCQWPKPSMLSAALLHVINITCLRQTCLVT